MKALWIEHACASCMMRHMIENENVYRDDFSASQSNIILPSTSSSIQLDSPSLTARKPPPPPSLRSPFAVNPLQSTIMVNTASVLTLVISSFLLGASTTSAAVPTPVSGAQLQSRYLCIPVSGGPCQDAWANECDVNGENVVSRRYSSSSSSYGPKAHSKKQIRPRATKKKQKISRRR